jgi:hypothetical protein
MVPRTTPVWQAGVEDPSKLELDEKEAEFLSMFLHAKYPP